MLIRNNHTRQNANKPVIRGKLEKLCEHFLLPLSIKYVVHIYVLFLTFIHQKKLRKLCLRGYNKISKTFKDFGISQ